MATTKKKAASAGNIKKVMFIKNKDLAQIFSNNPPVAKTPEQILVEFSENLLSMPATQQNQVIAKLLNTLAKDRETKVTEAQAEHEAAQDRLINAKDGLDALNHIKNGGFDALNFV
jgi:predicted nucleic-acid-binding protein